MISNVDIKKISALNQKKFRYQYHQFLIEGEKLTKDALKAHYPLEKIISTHDYATVDPDNILAKALKSGVETLEASLKQINRIASTQTPQPVVAIGKIPAEHFPPEYYLSTWNKIMVLDRIQDPGNMGSLIRAADWFQVDGILIGNGSADIFNPKVVRGSMGALFRIPIIPEIELETLTKKLKKLKITCLAADLSGKPLHIIEPPERWALFLGNEGQGLLPKILNRMDDVVSIPGNSKADSLNVAVSGGIFLYHFAQIIKG